MTKTCVSCTQSLPLSSFGVDRSTKDGLHRWCRTCNREHCRAYYRRTREFQIKRVTHWRLHRNEPNYRALRRPRGPEHRQIIYELKLLRAAAGARGHQNQITRDEWEQIRTQPCFYCGARDGLRNEHLIPVSAGGQWVAWNLVKACHACNMKKHDTDLITFAERIGRLDLLERVDPRVIHQLRNRLHRNLELLHALGY